MAVRELESSQGEKNRLARLLSFVNAHREGEETRDAKPFHDARRDKDKRELENVLIGDKERPNILRVHMRISPTPVIYGLGRVDLAQIGYAETTFTLGNGSEMPQTFIFYDNKGGGWGTLYELPKFFIN